MQRVINTTDPGDGIPWEMPYLPQFDDIIGVAARAYSRWWALEQDKIVRELLGRWVSEIEPAIAYSKEGRILGLTPADTPIGVKSFILPV